AAGGGRSFRVRGDVLNVFNWSNYDGYEDWRGGPGEAQNPAWGTPLSIAMPTRTFKLTFGVDWGGLPCRRRSRSRIRPAARPRVSGSGPAAGGNEGDWLETVVLASLHRRPGGRTVPAGRLPAGDPGSRRGASAAAQARRDPDRTRAAGTSATPGTAAAVPRHRAPHVPVLL